MDKRDMERKIVKGKILKTHDGREIQCDDEEHVGAFIFRPPIKDGHVADEMLLDAGRYFIHVEQMGTQSWWIGISDNSDHDQMVHLDFYVGEKKVRDEDGDAVYPLLLGVRGIVETDSPRPHGSTETP